MRMIDPIRGPRSGLYGLLTRLGGGEEFACGDCERWEQCGLPPNEDCIFKAAQLADGRWKARRRARALARIVGAT
jgi:hypothetical protein